MKQILIILLLLFASCKIADRKDIRQKELPFPRVWTTYSKVKSYDEDFADLKKHGIGAVVMPRSSEEALKAARKSGMKIIMEINDVTEQAYRIDSSKVVRAVMLAGAYNGRAIDRFRFAFEPKPQSIVIENPIYDKMNCYGPDLGHYFPGMKDPVKAEVIVKEADFDGQAHLKIIPATTDRVDDYHWNMKFDLTGVSGDLDHAVLAVYWISNGSLKYWMFGDNASSFAQSTKDAVAEAVRKEISSWKNANGGTFPDDIMVAACYGDECWNVTGHLNSEACSYPLWDYSDAAVKSFEENYPGEIYPRGKSWPDMFGRQAYANWLYNYHRSCAELAAEVKKTLLELGIQIPTYRNLTRSNVFAVQNDQDGTGLELLANEFDITLCDPYPVTPHRYCKDTIPSDMNYMAGLSRRFHKWLVPWMQAHEYLPERDFLVHPESSDIVKMISQHKQFYPDAAMWLGYGPGYTFPNVHPDAWEKAGEIQMTLFDYSQKPKAEFAAIRPYNVRALIDVDLQQNQDHYFTDFLFFASTDTLLYYDPFEPLTLQQIKSSELETYPVVFAEAGNLSKQELLDLSGSEKKVIFYIEGADHFNIDSELTGIESFQDKIKNPGKMIVNRNEIEISSLDVYKLGKNAEVLAAVDGLPVVWKVSDKLFIAGSSMRDSKDFYNYWLRLIN